MKRAITSKPVYAREEYEKMLAEIEKPVNESEPNYAISLILASGIATVVIIVHLLWTWLTGFPPL